MQNFFSLIKTAAPAIYSYKHIPKGENVPSEIAKRFFVFLQRNEGSPNEKSTSKGYSRGFGSEVSETLKDAKNTNPKTRFFFHGTNSAAFGKMYDYQLMKSPESALAWQGEARPGTQQLLYFSQNKGTCDGYSSSRTISGTVPVTLALKIPLCAIAEVRTAIFRPFVNSPYHPNEAGHQQNLSTRINPILQDISQKLTQVRSKLKRKEIEREMFSQLLQTLNDYFDQNAGEFTITHGVPLRYMQNVFFTNQVLSCKSYTELNKKLEENEKARKDFLSLMPSCPSLFSLLSPHQQNYKTAKIEASKAWFNKISNDPNQMFWVPESLMMPTQNPDLTFPDKKNKKQSLYTLVNTTIIPTLAENGRKTTSIESFSSWLGKLPKVTHANPAISQVIKEKMVNFAEEDADKISKLCGYLSSNFWGDDSFINTCIEKIWSKASSDAVEEIWRAEYSTVSYDDFPLINKVAYNPKAMLFYFSRAKLGDIKWNRFPINIIEPVQKELKEIIASKLEGKGLQSVDDALSILSSEESVHGTMPKMLMPEGLMESCLGVLVQKCDTNINDIINKISLIPAAIRDNITFKTAFKESLKKNVLDGSRAWRIISRYYPDFYNDPELAENKTSAEMLDTGLQYIKYDTLTDKQKIAYYDKAKNEIEDSYGLFKHLPDNLKKDKELIASYAKGFLNNFKYNYYEEIPEELKHLPGVFEQCLKIKMTNYEYTAINYEDVKKFPSLINDYIQKICEAVEYDPNAYGYGAIPDELKTNENILKSLSRGIGRYLIMESEVNIPNFNMDLLEKYKDDRYEYMIDRQCFKGIPYDSLSEELKTKYKTSLITSCNSDPSKYLQVTNESSIKNDPEVIKSLANGYVYEIKWNGNSSLPSQITESENFKIHHKEINNKLLASGKYVGIFYSALESEADKASYKKIVAQNLQSNPTIAKNLEQSILTDPEIVKSLTAGINYYTSCGYFDQSSEIINKIKHLPEYKDLENTIIQKTIIYYKQAATSSYPIKTIMRLRGISEIVVNDPEIISKLCQSIENISYSLSGLYAEGIEERITSFKDNILKNTNINDENKQKLISSLTKRSIHDNANKYYRYPGDWSYVEEEEKKQLEPILIDAFISFFQAGSMYVDDLISRYERIKNVFSYLPNFDKFKQHVIQILQNKKNGMSKGDKDYYYNNSKSYTNDQDIINIFIPSVNDMVTEINTILTNKSDPFLMSALNKLKTYVKYKDTPEYATIKEKIIDDLVTKVQESKSMNIKKNWCTILSENFPGHPKLNVCTQKKEPTLFNNNMMPNTQTVKPVQNVNNPNSPAPAKSILPPLTNAPIGLKNKLQLKKEKYNNMFTLKDNPQKTE